MAKVWSKRFDKALDPFIEKFNASIGFDSKLILEDLDCSIAHAKMLGKTQVLSSSETLQIINGLETIKLEYLEGKFSPNPSSWFATRGRAGRQVLEIRTSSQVAALSPRSGTWSLCLRCASLPL